jgi:hypothetical protein
VRSIKSQVNRKDKKLSIIHKNNESKDKSNKKRSFASIIQLVNMSHYYHIKVGIELVILHFFLLKTNNIHSNCWSMMTGISTVFLVLLLVVK